MDKQGQIKEFCKLWDLELSDREKFLQFKNRTLSTIGKIFGSIFCENRKLEEEFLYMIGEKNSRRIKY